VRLSSPRGVPDPHCVCESDTQVTLSLQSHLSAIRTVFSALFPFTNVLPGARVPPLNHRNPHFLLLQELPFMKLKHPPTGFAPYKYFFFSSICMLGPSLSFAPSCFLQASLLLKPDFDQLIPPPSLVPKSPVEDDVPPPLPSLAAKFLPLPISGPPPDFFANVGNSPFLSGRLLPILHFFSRHLPAFSPSRGLAPFLIFPYPPPFRGPPERQGSTCLLFCHLFFPLGVNSVPDSTFHPGFC